MGFDPRSIYNTVGLPYLRSLAAQLLRQVSALLALFSVEEESVSLSSATVHCWEIVRILWSPAQEKFAGAVQLLMVLVSAGGTTNSHPTKVMPRRGAGDDIGARST